MKTLRHFSWFAVWPALAFGTATAFGATYAAPEQSPRTRASARPEDRAPAGNSQGQAANENDQAYKLEYRPDVLRERDQAPKDEAKLKRDEAQARQRQLDIQNRK